MKKGLEKEEIRQLQIQPLNDDVLGNLSIGELEERLELQILQMTEAQICWDYGDYYVGQYTPFNSCAGECDTLCAGNL